MNSNAMSKLSAVFFVLVMALSALVALPNSSVDAADETNDINLQVLNADNGITIKTADVKLINVYTGEIVEAEYSSGLYIATAPPSGVYRVQVTDEYHYDNIDAISGGLHFDALAPYTPAAIELGRLPSKIHTWNVTVENSEGTPQSGATVGFYDDLNREIVAHATTNSDGYALVDMWDLPTPGDIWMFVEKAEFETYVAQVPVTSDDSQTVVLSDPKTVGGYVTDSGGHAADNTVAYLVNDDDSIPWIKRVLKSDLGGARYELYGYEGTFTLCVDAYGLSAVTESVEVLPSTTHISKNYALPDQTKRQELISIEYGADLNSFDFMANTTWSYDEAFPGLPYSDVGSLRMQIDLNTEYATDGVVDVDEAFDFFALLDDYGPEYPTTGRLMTVNDTAFESSGAFDYTLGSLVGSVDDESAVTFNYSTSYTSVEAIDVDAPDYFMEAWVKYDTPAVDYVYSISLISGYEMVANTSTAEDFVDPSGFMVVTLDPQDPEGSMIGPKLIGMTIAQSEGPDAYAGIVESEYVYEVMDEDGVNVTGYIVRVGEEINFTAEDSFDPNGNPMMYTWDFGDGTAPETTYNKTIMHNYSSASADRTVSLTVTDMGGLVNSTELQLICDDKDPVPVINIKDLVVNETSGMLEIDQSEVVWFNTNGTTDDAVAAGDEIGEIMFFEFEYGEGNTSGRVYMTEDELNVSHAWEDAGVYNLTLNVTDVVGHWKNTTIQVKVNDTEAPKATFTAKNETWGTSLVEQHVIVFDANGTEDNTDNNTVLMFSWYFDDDKGDESWLNGTGLYNVTHTFDKAGSYSVRVNVTDTEGNYNGYTKVVTIVSGPRPNVIIDEVTFDPEIFTEGSQGYIIVNLTNRGSAVATNVELNFYIANLDGTEDKLGEWTTILNTTSGTVTTTIEIGGTAYVRFPYTLDDPGSYTIRVNVTSTDQLLVDEDVGDVEVKEAGWKKVALWGGVAGVIILVPLLIYMRGRWAKRDRSGPRREKARRERKEKAKEKEKEKDREKEKAREKDKLKDEPKDEGL
jgi:hypothetical protein